MTTTAAPTNNGTALAKNPFGSVAEREVNAAAEAESQRAIGEIQAAMIIAQRFPRNMAAKVGAILNTFTRPSLCEKAMYEYARGGTDISGLSIRAAEAIAQDYGNMQFGVRELEQRGGHSLVQAYCWDVQNNTRSEKTFQVEHKRDTKKGSYRLEDARDIYELVANQGARRLRACILALIPVDVQEAVIEQIELTLKTNVQVTPERITSLVDMFTEVGVPKRAIENFIQRSIDAITPIQMVRLGRIYTAIKDGMGKPADYFEIDEQPKDGGDPPASRVDELKKKHGQPATPAAADAPEDAKPPEPQAQAPAAEATPSSKAAPVGDENAKRKDLRTAIVDAWKHVHNDVFRDVLTREFAKKALPDLTTAQLSDFLERTPQLLEEYA